MPQNDFLPFASGAGANVLSQAAYAALAAIAQGFQSGTAQSAACNKAWRQSSVMAAVLGAFINARTGQDAIDDGTTATLLTNLLKSSAALNGDNTQTFSVAAATQPSHAAQLAQVGGYAGFIAYNASQVLTNAVANFAVQNYAAGAVTFTLPLGSTMKVGQIIDLYNDGGSTLTIATQGGDYIAANGQVQPFVIQLGESLKVLWRGTPTNQEWDVVGGSAHSMNKVRASGGYWSVYSPSLSVGLTNNSTSTIQSVNVSLPAGNPGAKYRLIVRSHFVVQQQSASTGFQNFASQINDGTSTVAAAGWLGSGVNSTGTTQSFDDTLIMGPYSAGQAITLTQSVNQAGGSWNGVVTQATLNVQAVLSAN